MEEKPTYYSIIPASVRYDKNLKANEKLLYSEITVLCNKNGYCYASNDYFSKLYEVHKNTISLWINNLKDRGYIGTKIIYKSDNKTIDKRVIYLSEIILREIAENYCEKHKEGINEIIDRYLRNNLDPINEKVEENNTSINIYNNNNNKNVFELIEENFGRTLSPLEIEEIATWEDTELTKYAIKQAVLKGICNIKYISKILYEYQKNNIKTIQQAQQREQEFEKRKQGKQQHTVNNSNHSENLSKWDEVRKRVEEKRKNERRRSI